jgi:voltage-gated potassium channel
VWLSTAGLVTFLARPLPVDRRPSEHGLEVIAIAERPRVRSRPLAEHRARLTLQRRLAAWLDMPLAVLGLVMLVLLVAGLFVDQESALGRRIEQGQTAIRAIFALDFAVELALAPSKLRFLRRHWLTAVAVALPALRGVRILRAARALRGISLVRLLTTVNRAAGALGRIARRGELGYVLLLTAAVTVSAAAGVYYFERDAPGAAITSPGSALWWAATLATTMNSGLETTTLEGHAVGLLLRVYALAVSGYLTATIAVYLWGGRDEPAPSDLRAVRDELAALRRELARLAGVVDGRFRPGEGAPNRADFDAPNGEATAGRPAAS